MSESAFKLDSSGSINQAERLGLVSVDAPRPTPGAESGPVVSLDSERPAQSGLAEAARQAGRANASLVSQEEHQALLDERQQLLDLLFSETISTSQKRRLEFVRWNLDRIEDAQTGKYLDQLELLVNMREGFGRDIDRYVKHLSDAVGSRSPGKRQ
jgi:hypothetical protein